MERVWIEIDVGTEIMGSAMMRYDLLERLQASAARRDVAVLAFGFGRRDIRLVLDGDDEAVANVLRGVKVGTARVVHSRGGEIVFAPSVREPIPPNRLEDAVVWAHQAPLGPGMGPLASPWSSHRDLLGYRRAPFFDARPLQALVDVGEVHARAGGRDLPATYAGWTREPKESLGLLLRLAAAVRGVLPADRRCFRLFVHLARARGWQTRHLAKALRLTGRRIRQLAEHRDPLLTIAKRCLADPRLCRVP